MSIANLSDFPIVVSNLETDNIDTVNDGDPLTIGTVKANPVTIGQVGRAVNINGRLQTKIIDVPNVIDTLFIGPDVAKDIAIGGPTGNPVVIPRGIITTKVDRGSTVGAGELEIGGDAPTTSLAIGNAGAPIALISSSLSFPGTTPYSLSTTGATVTQVMSYSGAVNTANAAIVSYYRFGDWVSLEVRPQLPPQPITAVGQPITLVGALIVGYRPVAPHNIAVDVFDTGNSINGLVVISNTGDLIFGDGSSQFTGPNVGILGCTFTFNAAV